MSKIYQKMYPKKKSRSKGVLGGFTLIELLVVVLIVGILAAIALPQYQRAVERSRATEAMTNLRALVNAEKIYKMANGEPTKDLTLLDIQLSGEMNADGEMVLPFFTYHVGNISNTTKEGFEVIATRNNEKSDLTDYYVYYNYNGQYACVAKKPEAKSICSAICSSSMTDHSVAGYYVCMIK